jgi:hypothetical protein
MRHQEGFTMHNKESDGEEAFYKEISEKIFAVPITCFILVQLMQKMNCELFKKGFTF